MKSILLLCTSLLLYLSVSAQGSDKDSQNNAEKPSKSFKERIYFGGNVGLNIGTRTLIQANPLVGYRITDKYSAGVGVNYSYFNVDPITQNTYGGSVFNRLIVLPNVFAQAEFELLYNTVSQVGFEEKQKTNFPALLVGGGGRQPLGGNSSLTFTVQYDLIQDPNSIYGNDLIIRGGINAGF